MSIAWIGLHPLLVNIFTNSWGVLIRTQYNSLSTPFTPKWPPYPHSFPTSCPFYFLLLLLLTHLVLHLWMSVGGGAIFWGMVKVWMYEELHASKTNKHPHTHTNPPCLFGVYLVQGSGLNMLQEIKWQPLSLPFNKQPDWNYQHPLIEKASDRFTMIWHLSLWIWDNKGEQPTGWSKVHIDNLFANKGEKKLYCKTIQMRLPCIKPQWFKKWAIRKAILMFFLIQALRELSNHCCN